MNVNMFDTRFAKSFHLRSHAMSAGTFLVKNLTRIQLSEEDMDEIRKLRILSQNPVGVIAQQILNTQRLSQYLIFNLSNFTASVPEALSYNEITIDGKLLGDAVPEVLQRAWLNITPMTAKRSANPVLVITDIPALCGQLVRGMLIMSYNDSDAWLTPRLAAFIIESYSMTISTLIDRMYVLDPMELRNIQTLIAAYYAQLCGGKELSKEIPELLFRCTSLGSIADIRNNLDVYAEAREQLNNGYELNWDVIETLLKTKGPERMKNFNKYDVTKLFTGSAVDSQALSIAMDYPPYWVTEVLKVISGTKILNIDRVMKQTSFRKQIPGFVEDLVKSETFIRSVNR